MKFDDLSITDPTDNRCYLGAAEICTSSRFGDDMHLNTSHAPALCLVQLCTHFSNTVNIRTRMNPNPAHVSTERKIRYH